MRILDIDLDVFVSPRIICRKEGSRRPPDSEHEIPSDDEVHRLITENWRIDSNTPINCLEWHVEIIKRVEHFISTGDLTPPFKWFHIDAHDDFYGFHSRPVSSENFMFELIRRGWCEEVCWIHPDGGFDFPSAILDQNTNDIYFDGYRVPVIFMPLSKFRLGVAADFAFLTRSPEFSPSKADRLYELIVGAGRAIQQQIKSPAEQVGASDGDKPPC